MNNDTKIEFFNQFRRSTNNRTVVDRILIIHGILKRKSFRDYKSEWINRSELISSSSSNFIFNDMIFLDIDDDTEFTLNDYEYILWIGFIDTYGLVNNPSVTWSFADQMSLEIFESPAYSIYLGSVLLGLPATEHPLSNYIVDKRSKLIISERNKKIDDIITNG